MATEPTVSVLVIPEQFRHMEQVAGKMAKDNLRAVVQLREPGHAHTIYIHPEGFDIVETCDEDGDHSFFCATAMAFRHVAERLDAHIEIMDPLALATRHAHMSLVSSGGELCFGFNPVYDRDSGWLIWRTYPTDINGNRLTAAELLAEEA
jgi:hypothetical protein